ncbi:MAG: Holliday junction ATP-dependent DNA helicase RuvA [Candidatus Omnitrophica bacterium]|nr:Holliday junction ATP-dependent DNA helicase RuvA [Candidatus Omnitrophota bacterium]
MIARISGKIIEKGSNYLLIETAGLCYEVYLPATVMQRLSDSALPQSTINLVTYHYHQLEPSKSTPVLIGFLNEIEKDFFGIFITVSGIGPRAALKALNQPISRIAQAIDEADTNFLTSLPGIGQQRAREIIAKLQNKVGKFALIQDEQAGEEKTLSGGDIVQEALDVLMQLEYKRPEALSMIKKAMERQKNIQTTEALLNEVYKQRKAK